MTAAPETVSTAPPKSVRRFRPLLIVVAVVVLSIWGVIALRPPTSTTTLDPESPAPQGSLALANLLRNSGVEVTRVRSLSEATNTPNDKTLLIINSSLIGEAAAEKLSNTSAKRTVIVGATGAAADFLSTDVLLTDLQDRPADCELPEAVAAGSAMFEYELVGEDTRACFPGDIGAGLLYQDSTLALADGTPLMNDNLAESGNAALGMNLLSTTDEVLWYLPSVTDPELLDGQAQDFTELLPDWFAPVLWQGLILFGALAIWRGRRLGPLLKEPLPIVVQAHETDQGYASLLQRNQQAELAAQILRDASNARLAHQCGLPPTVDTFTVARAVANRIGEPETRIMAILRDQPVTSDADLVELRAQLKNLERKAHIQ